MKLTPATDFQNLLNLTHKLRNEVDQGSRIFRVSRIMGRGFQNMPDPGRVLQNLADLGLNYQNLVDREHGFHNLVDLGLNYQCS